MLGHDAPVAVMAAPSMEHTIRAWHSAGRSQRAIARELNIDRRKVKRMVDSIN
jgi:DNA-binding transcriptional regulator LsrR (DeoR family)